MKTLIILLIGAGLLTFPLHSAWSLGDVHEDEEMTTVPEDPDVAEAQVILEQGLKELDSVNAGEYEPPEVEEPEEPDEPESLDFFEPDEEGDLEMTEDSGYEESDYSDEASESGGEE